MKISLNWLRRYVDVAWDAAEIARRLTLAGLEVESVTPVGGGLDGVIVARVLEARQHPNADKLRLARVDTGAGELDVVCGAPNCRTGLTVALAQVGAKLPGGLEIAKARIRGEESAGMLCSETELGLSGTGEGILELDAALTPGQPLAEALQLADTVLEISLTANRGDGLSHVGIARELAALAGVPLLLPEVGPLPLAPGEAVPVTIRDRERCARYVGRVIRGLKVGPSPLWMRRLLEAVGLRAINNLVDVANFVLMELGQPLHAFDLRDLRGPAIEVRTARAGERMSTLDGVERTFTPDDLLICDAERPVAVAGVMGGQDSEVKSDTTDVLLESAWFLPTSVRATSRRLGLRSESSHRFERAIDPGITRLAADRAAQLLCELSAPGSTPHVVEALTDEHPRTVTRPVVEYAPAAAGRLLGVEIDPLTQRVALERLGFKVTPDALHPDQPWRVATPSWRADVSFTADLIEEIARFVGYDVIPTAPVRTSGGSGAGLAREQRLRTLRRSLLARGYSQALSFSFLPRELLAVFDQRAPMTLVNPLTEDQRVLRTTLVPRLLTSVRHNLRHGAPEVRLFELGRVFHPRGAAAEQPLETDRLALVLAGRVGAHWSGGKREADFFDLKGLVEDLCAGLRRPAPVFTQSDTTPWLHPGATSTVTLEGAPLGVLGELHPATARALELSGKVLVAELDVGPLLAAPGTVRFADFTRLPAVSRDLALLLPKTVSAAQVLSVIEDLRLHAIDSVEIFDVYQGESLGPDKRSVGVSLTWRAVDRTLTDEEVNDAHGKVVREVERMLGAVRR